MTTDFNYHNLRGLLNITGQLSVEESLSILSSLITLLDQVHRSTGNCYGKLQSQNILISQNQEISLAYKPTLENQGKSCSDQSVDILGLGKIFFEMLTGTPLGSNILEWRGKYSSLKKLKNMPQIQEFCWRMLARLGIRFSSLIEIQKWLVALQSPYNTSYILWFACQEWYYHDFSRICEESRHSNLLSKFSPCFSTPIPEKLDTRFRQNWRTSFVQIITQNISKLSQEEIQSLVKGLVIFPEQKCLKKILSRLSIQEKNECSFLLKFYDRTNKKYFKKYITKKIQDILKDKNKWKDALSFWLTLVSPKDAIDYILKGLEFHKTSQHYSRLSRHEAIVQLFRTLPEEIWESTITSLFKLSNHSENFIRYTAIRLLKWICIGPDCRKQPSYLWRETHRIQQELWQYISENISTISDEKISEWLYKKIETPKIVFENKPEIIEATIEVNEYKEKPKTQPIILAAVKEDDDDSGILDEIEQAVEAEIAAEENSTQDIKTQSIQNDLEAIYDAEDIYGIDAEIEIIGKHSNIEKTLNREPIVTSKVEPLKKIEQDTQSNDKDVVIIEEIKEENVDNQEISNAFDKLDSEKINAEEKNIHDKEVHELGELESELLTELNTTSMNHNPEGVGVKDSIFCEIQKALEILKVSEQQLMELILDESINAYYIEYETKFVESEIRVFWKNTISGLSAKERFLKIIDILHVFPDEILWKWYEYYKKINRDINFESLLEFGCPSEIVSRIMAILYSIPFLKLKAIKLDWKTVDECAFLFAKRKNDFPLYKEGIHLVVATSDWSSFMKDYDYLKFALGCEIKVVIAMQEDILFIRKEYLAKYKPELYAELSEIEPSKEDILKKISEVKEKELEEIQDLESEIEEKSKIVEPLLPAAFPMESILEKPQPIELTDAEIVIPELPELKEVELPPVTEKPKEEAASISFKDLQCSSDVLDILGKQQEYLMPLESDETTGALPPTLLPKPPKSFEKLPDVDKMAEEIIEEVSPDVELPKSGEEGPDIKQIVRKSRAPLKPPSPDIIQTFGLEKDKKGAKRQISRGKKAKPKTEPELELPIPELLPPGPLFPSPQAPPMQQPTSIDAPPPPPPPPSALPTIPALPQMSIPKPTYSPKDEMLRGITLPTSEKPEAKPIIRKPAGAIPFEPIISSKDTKKEERLESELIPTAPPPPPMMAIPPEEDFSDLEEGIPTLDDGGSYFKKEKIPQPKPAKKEDAEFLCKSPNKSLEWIAFRNDTSVAKERKQEQQRQDISETSMEDREILDRKKRDKIVAKPKGKAKKIVPLSRKKAKIRDEISKIPQEAEPEIMASMDELFGEGDADFEAPEYEELKPEITAEEESELLDTGKRKKAKIKLDRVQDKISELKQKIKEKIAEEKKLPKATIEKKTISKKVPPFDQTPLKMPTPTPLKFEKTLGNEAGKPGPFERFVAQSVLMMKTFQVILGLKFVLFAQAVDIIIQTITSYITNIYNTWKLTKTIHRAWQRQQSGQLQQAVLDDFQKGRIQFLRFLNLPGFVLEDQIKRISKKDNLKELSQNMFPLQLALELRGHLDEMKRDLSLLTTAQRAEFVKSGLTDFLISFIPNPVDFLIPWKDFFIMLFWMKYSRTHTKIMYAEFLISYQAILKNLAEQKKADWDQSNKYQENSISQKPFPKQPMFYPTSWENYLLQSVGKEIELWSIEDAIKKARTSLQRILQMSCKLDICLQPRIWQRWELLFDTYQMNLSQTQHPLLFLELERWLTQTVGQLLHDKGMELNLEERQARLKEIQDFQRRYRLQQKIAKSLL